MNIELTKLVSPIASFFHRFHTIIFFLLVSAGLASAILILLSIISVSGTASTTPDDQINGSFDTETIKRIDALGSSEVPEPGNRPSPFVE